MPTGKILHLSKVNPEGSRQAAQTHHLSCLQSDCHTLRPVATALIGHPVGDGQIAGQLSTESFNSDAGRRDAYDDDSIGRNNWSRDSARRSVTEGRTRAEGSGDNRRLLRSADQFHTDRLACQIESRLTTETTFQQNSTSNGRIRNRQVNSLLSQTHAHSPGHAPSH
jgi:hypothetical protein